jgi:LuxR family transcriptional regulator, maltose regulon positive regulatory protein
MTVMDPSRTPIRAGPPAPRHPVVIPARLRSRGEALLSAPALLVRAPAGYGKTSVVAALTREHGIEPAWRTLTPEDAGIPALLSGIALAIRSRLPSVGDRTLASLRGSDAPFTYRTLVRDLAGEVADAAVSPVHVVLDDLDEILEAPGPLDALDVLVGVLPWQLHVIVLSRTEPLLPSLHRLLAGGSLETVTLEDLRLDQGDVVRFFDEVFSRTVAPDQAGRILELTEGWPIALRLLERLLEQEPDIDWSDWPLAIGDRRSTLFGYLAAEVLARTAPELREFVRATALLDDLDPDVVAELTGIEEPLPLMQSLSRSALPVSRVSWGVYRCHRLLRDHLVMQMSPSERREGHRRAARALARRSRWEPALRHAREAGDWELATEVIGERGVELAQHGHADLVRSVGIAIPEELVTPNALWRTAMATFRTGDPGGAGLALRRAESLFRDRGDLDRAREVLEDRVRLHFENAQFGEALEAAREIVALTGSAPPAERAAATLAFLAPGLASNGESRRAHQVIRSALPDLDVPPSVSPPRASLALTTTALVLGRAGHATTATELLGRSEALARGAGDLVLVSYSQWVRGLTTFWWGDLEAGLEAARAAAETSAAIGYVQRRSACRMLEAVCSLVLGDVEAFDRGRREALQMGEGATLLWAHVLEIAARGRERLLKDGPEPAVVAVDECLRIALQLGQPWLACLLQMEAGYLRALAGDTDGAAAALEEGLRNALQEDSDLLRAMGHLLRSTLDGPESRGELGRGLEIVEGRGLWKLAHFWTERTALRRTLARAVSEGDQRWEVAVKLLAVDGPDAVEALVPLSAHDDPAVRERAAVALGAVPHSAARDPLRRLARDAQPEVRALARRILERAGVEPGERRRGLSRRELEVLTLLCRGLRTKEIAATLFVTPATVATHVGHILAKLGMSSRAELIAFALREHLVDHERP